MALQTSGPISISDIKTELGSSENSLAALSLEAGFSAPHSMSEFYGYSAVPPVVDVGYNVVWYGNSYFGLVQDYASGSASGGDTTLIVGAVIQRYNFQFRYYYTQLVELSYYLESVNEFANGQNVGSFQVIGDYPTAFYGIDYWNDNNLNDNINVIYVNN